MFFQKDKILKYSLIYKCLKMHNVEIQSMVMSKCMNCGKKLNVLCLYVCYAVSLNRDTERVADQVVLNTGTGLSANVLGLCMWIFYTRSK